MTLTITIRKTVVDTRLVRLDGFRLVGVGTDPVQLSLLATALQSMELDTA